MQSASNALFHLFNSKPQPLVEKKHHDSAGCVRVLMTGKG